MNHTRTSTTYATWVEGPAVTYPCHRRGHYTVEAAADCAAAERARRRGLHTHLVVSYDGGITWMRVKLRRD
jgi:hypothetical protein